ncbi:unnamed protein product [Vitrella brassicaformis CCMP3155]|uniref:GPN-loop GTPase 2 n=1 Tax=Vitrella brassicaformis (strain CCMP3155) TaxID=1169540 RepID=A0A0G4EFC9_VITBC|nr:unnamed protein product [Vitrella brassicaformis CCMP3155]|mmetsp:Transcript_1224/g.2723  ORF Transcript_1224/g.2723 Transcript_1224/m.2723 type:complete len:318 (-) Transcript_1224:357-1310(-)|eukprot:CEL94063.1 unnamed protein product [Vitrella brassicaformis CCMP3155]
MWFGQWVIGPPGSGKSTYCNAMQQMCRALSRPHVVVNLDPANDGELPYDVTIDVRTLVSAEQVMQEHKLGPNGGLLYCMEYLLVNFDWLEAELRKHPDTYVLFDCPGQVELYTHEGTMRNILEKLGKIDCRLTAVHLIDSMMCTEAHKYISGLLLCLSSMLLLELPHVNVLSKVDLLRIHKEHMDFPLDYYAEADDLKRLLSEGMPKSHPFNARFAKFTEMLGEVVEDFSMVSLVPLDIQDKDSVLSLLQRIDKGNGYAFGSTPDVTKLFSVALKNDDDGAEDRYGSIQERYMGDDEEDDSLRGGNDDKRVDSGDTM